MNSIFFFFFFSSNSEIFEEGLGLSVLFFWCVFFSFCKILTGQNCKLFLFSSQRRDVELLSKHKLDNQERSGEQGGWVNKLSILSFRECFICSQSVVRGNVYGKNCDKYFTMVSKCCLWIPILEYVYIFFFFFFFLSNSTPFKLLYFFFSEFVSLGCFVISSFIAPPRRIGITGRERESVQEKKKKKKLFLYIVRKVINQVLPLHRRYS